MAKLKVFVSHLHSESIFVDCLKAQLERDFMGIVQPFASSDGYSVLAGKDWLKSILDAVKESRLHLVLCSKDAETKPWINYEAGAAQVQGVPLVVLCHSGSKPEELPIPLNLSQQASITDSVGLERLYGRIAELIGCRVPVADFQGYASAYRQLEEEYGRARNIRQAPSPPVSVHISNPHILCISSEQFLDLGFKNQIQLVLDAFPQDLQHARALTSKQLRNALAGNVVDVIHIASYVCPRSGDLYFTEVDPRTGESRTDPADIMNPKVLAGLLERAGTRLAVICGCESLPLINDLLKVTNVIAPRDLVSANQMASWVQTFYSALRSEPLSEAAAIAGEASGAPMFLYGQQPYVMFDTRDSDPTVRAGSAGR